MFHYDICSISIFILLSSNLTSYLTLVNSYVVPTPTFEVLNPKGILISISDEPGIQFFAFQGNINRTIKLNEVGRISGEVYKKNNGKWIIQNRNMILENGDVIHYWTYVQVNGIMYNRGEETWTITATKELVFDETFDIFNNSLWRHETKIPLNPDYEFCIYHNRQHTFVASVKNGMLKIKPAILENHYGVNATMYGTLLLSECSSTIRDECRRKATSFSILPPIISTRLITKNSFYFRYGKIEIRAKFPEGDWLYPEMWLKPKYDYYGPDYSSGCIVLGLARGNDNLVNTVDGSIYDSRRLDFGVRIGTGVNITNHMVSQTRENGPRWTQDFHVYTTIWNSKGFQFLVDGEEVGKLNPPTDGWMYGNNFTQMAPFDQEFHIVIGVGVGGIRVFPDKTISSGHKKPWKNIEAKAMLNFWHAKDKWLPSWSGKNAFEIDYIRVWSS